MDTFAPQDHQILLVDDEVQNIDILSHLLSTEGYGIAAITEPKRLLEALPSIQPDLILLDVVMPEVSGYTLCEQIKSDPTYANLPIVFLTAKGETQSVIEGFKVGGSDYITKPFSSAELLARVKNHLIIRQQHKKLLNLNAEKNNFLTVASHDVRGPLANIMTVSKLLEKETRKFDEETVQMLQIVTSSAQRCLNIVNDLLNVHHIEAGLIQPDYKEVSLGELLQQFLTLYQYAAQKKNIEMVFEVSSQACLIKSDSRMLAQIFDNLLSNALKYSPEDSTVTLSLKQLHNHCEVTIQDQGPGFSSQDREQMYQKFKRLSAKPTANENSTGLGLSIVKELCEKLSINIELPPVSLGACFVLTLPHSIRPSH